ncbi:MAG: hypothetical protein QNJ46_21350 [Leptolyngbyaceae cyanobacterium MO_188.B28]|nr:hypothetical protein [Leptolyngbyaceae cyanobacterium MO_188.B28]
MELIALDQWIDSPASVLYGAVTSGDIWKFGLYQRQTQQVQKDINTYSAPNDLDQILSILFGVTLNSPIE